MKNKEKRQGKRTLIEEIKLYLRGIHVVWEINPKIIVLIIFEQIFGILQGYVLLFASSLVLNGLYRGDKLEKLILRAAACVAITFILNILNMLFRNIRSKNSDTLYALMSAYVSRARLFHPYAYTEDSQLEQLYQRAKDSIMGVTWNYGRFFQMLLNLVTAFSVSLGVVFAHAGPESVGTEDLLPALVNSPLALGLIIVMTAVTTKLDFHFNKINGKKLYQYERSHDNLYNISNYYSNFGRDTGNLGMDMRIFGLGKIITSERHRYFYKGKYYRGKVGIEIRGVFFSRIIGFLLQSTVYAYAALRAYYGVIQIGDFVLYAGALSNLTGAVRGLAEWMADVYSMNNDLADAFRYLDLPNTMYQGTLPVDKRIFCDGGSTNYEIEFRDVSFRYPGTEEWALRHVSIKFRVGEKLAVVGRNGSGKTTFIKLLCRLYDPTEGKILLNGVEIQKYDYNEYMSVFSVVFQDFKLFSYMIGQNVACSNKYDRERVIDCCKKAGLDLHDAPVNGENVLTPETVVYKMYDSCGVEISGGEAQKLALARALYKTAPFIVLDEPTAALDPIAEAEIYARFNDMVGERTAIYISHRLSSCRFCDEIAVFDGGEIVEKGRHEKLIEENGLYRELWMAQARYYY